ncbi:MAG: hypothetical protein K2K34_08100 [Oscillospiraceae bacterium]|nr:hypothetical protein [Oscillospiraceae bacterium]
MDRENMAGNIRKHAKKLFRVLAYILVLAADIYLLMFSVSLIIVNDYDLIEYRSGGFGRIINSVTIDLQSGSGHIKYRPFMSDEIILDTDIDVSLETLDKLKLRMAFSLAPFWSSEYVNPNIMDGTQWHFYFYRGDDQDSPKRVYGSNAYPIGFSGIKSLLHDLRDQALQDSQVLRE